MKLIYIDEAGNTGTKADPSQPIHMIGTLIVDQWQIKEVEDKVNAIALETEKKISGPRHFIPADDIEFHGSDLFNGKEIFKAVPPETRVDICAKIVDVAVSSKLIFGHCAVDKFRLWANAHPHMLCFQFTLERVQDYLGASGDLGLIVADEHKELEQQLIRNLATSKRGNTGWGWRPTQITHIVDTVHFVKSCDNRLVQICDVLTYFRLKRIRLENKMTDAYLASGQRATGQSYSDYVETELTLAEKAVWSLSNQIARIERFSKIWPI